MEAVKKELGSVTQETRRLDMDVNCLRQDVDSVQESNAAVRATLENTRERAGRLSLQITNAERQITSAVKVRPECL
jgi:septal ring factor EnvC (AmiA/AmiB activator)